MSNFLFIFFWLVVAHAIADYPLQSVEMAKFKNKKNAPVPPPGATPVSVWFAYLTAHAMIHAGLVALVVGPKLGFILGLVHWVQDYLKCKLQYSPNTDQVLHLFFLAIIALIYIFT